MLETLKKYHRYTYGIAYVFFILILLLLLKYLSSQPIVFLALFIYGSFAINWFYARFLNVPILPHVLASTFSPIGFFYLMGYSHELPNTWSFIKGTIDLYRHNMKIFLEYSLVFFIFSVVVTSLSTYIEVWENHIGNTSGILLGIFLLFRLLVILFGFVLSIAFLRVVAARIIGVAPHHMSSEIFDAFSLFWSCVFVTLVLMVLLFVLNITQAFFPIFIFLAILIIWFIFSIHAVVIENIRGFSAFGYSKKLVRGRAWSVLWILVALTGLFAFIAYFIQGILVAPFFDMLLQVVSTGSSFSIILNNIFALINAFVQTMLMPLYAFIPSTLLYFQLKRLHEEKKEV